MVIREGHVAENFYMILSGSAIVTKLVRDDDAGTVELKFDRILSKGDSFGVSMLTKCHWGFLNMEVTVSKI